VEESDSIMWIGTGDGLNRFNRETEHFTNYFIEDGLPSNKIKSMQWDDDGNLWMGTNKGLSRLNPKTMEFKNFTIEDGLQSNQFSRNSSLKTQDGDLYFGGVNGFNSFDPRSIIDNQFIPPVIINGFKLFNTEVVPGEDAPIQENISKVDEITLSYRQSFFSFSFVALNYVASEKNKYQYQLVGFDADWIASGSSTSASYTNVDPGEYTFKVKASNNDGVWNDNGTSLKITILPPWWQTIWFRLAALTFIAGLIIFIARRRKRLHTYEKQKLQDEIRKATDEVNVQKDALLEERDRLKKVVAETNIVIQKAVESGDFSARMETGDKTGAWKELSDSINKLFESIVIPLNEMNRVVSHLAEGDLTQRFSKDSRGDAELLATNLNTALENISSLLREIIADATYLKESSSAMLETGESMTITTSEIANSTAETSR